VNLHSVVNGLVYKSVDELVPILETIEARLLPRIPTTGTIVFTSEDHGLKHLRIVSLLAGLIAGEEDSDVLTAMVAGYLHDCQRTDEWSDELHGSRSDVAALKLIRDVIPQWRTTSEEYLDGKGIADAIQHHNNWRGYTASEAISGGLITNLHPAAELWDADRISLLRLDYTIDTQLLSTAYARRLVGAEEHYALYEYVEQIVDGMNRPEENPRAAKDPYERVMARLDTSDPNACWIWPGPITGYEDYKYPIVWETTQKGYKRRIVTRLIWERFKGVIPKGMVITLACGNTLCCNLSHFKLVHLSSLGVPFGEGKYRCKFGEEHGIHKLSTQDISGIRKLHSEGVSINDLADYYGITARHIAYIVKYRSRVVPGEFPNLEKEYEALCDELGVIHRYKKQGD
jgi:hypothetical protein